MCNYRTADELSLESQEIQGSSYPYAYTIWTLTNNPQYPTNNLHIHLPGNQLDPSN